MGRSKNKRNFVGGVWVAKTSKKSVMYFMSNTQGTRTWNKVPDKIPRERLLICTRCDKIKV